jgi:uncharacterized alpha-E superfamily protein
MQLGKYLERADATTRLVDVKYHILLPSWMKSVVPIDNVQWIAVLKSCSAYEAYQRRYVAKITPVVWRNFWCSTALFRAPYASASIRFAGRYARLH